MSWFRQHKKAAWISLSAVVAVLIVLGLVYFVYFHERSAKAQAAAAQKQTPPLRVQVVEPKDGGVERLVRRPATVQSFEFADLFGKVSGFLSNQKVDIGDKVDKGDLLAEIDAPELYANVTKAGADVKKAEANAKASEARVNKTEADQKAAQALYEQAQADVEKDRAMLALRKKQYARFYKLAKSSSVQMELVDEKLEAQYAAESVLHATKKAVNAAKSNVVSAKAAVEQAKADHANALAAVGVAQAVLDYAKTMAKYTKIVSPYDGVVTKRSFHNGDFIRADIRRVGWPILAVARTDKMRVIVQVPDRDVPFLEVGDKVTLDINTLPNRHFKGKVARKAYHEAYDTRTMRTEVDLLNPDGLLEDGMYGEITIHLGREEGMRIPSKCLSGNQKGKERSVFVVRDDAAHEVKVQIGIDDGIEVTIRDGLSASDQVVLERPPGLADGSRVEVIRGDKDKADEQEKMKASKNKKGPISDNDRSGQKKSKGK